MKKWSKILLVIVLVLVVLGVIVFTLKPEKTSSSSVKQNNQNETLALVKTNFSDLIKTLNDFIIILD